MKINSSISPEMFNSETSTLFNGVRKQLIQQFLSHGFKVGQVNLPSFYFKTTVYGSIYYKNYSQLSDMDQFKVRFNYLKMISEFFKTSYSTKIRKASELDTEAVLYIMPKARKDFSMLNRITELVFLRIIAFSYYVPDHQNEFGLMIKFGTYLYQIDTEHALRFFDSSDITASWREVNNLTNELKRAITTASKAIRLTDFE